MPNADLGLGARLPDVESVLSGPMRAFVQPDAGGEQLTVYTDQYAGTDRRGLPSWDRDTTGTEIPGRITERGQPVEIETAGGETVVGSYNIFVPSNAPVQDGLQGERRASSRIESEEGDVYEVVKLIDEQNGLSRILARPRRPDQGGQ